MELVISKYEDVKDELDKGLVFVEFFTTWCGDCRIMAPTIQKLYDNYGHSDKIRFFKINAEASNQYKAGSSKFKIERIPTHILARDGKVLHREIEYHPYEELESWILSELDK